MIYIVMILIFILGQSFFSGMETGLVSVLKPRARRGVDKDEAGAKDLLYFIERPGILLSTTLIGTNICVVISSNMAKKASEHFGLKSPEFNIIISCVMALILLNAEIIPKDWFRQFPYARCRKFIFLFKAAYYIFYLPSNLLSIYTKWINRVSSARNAPPQDARVIMRKDLLLLLRDSQKAGVVDDRIADIIDKALYFHNLRVADFMVERKNVIEIKPDASAKEAFEKAKQYNISRMPVGKKISADGETKWCGIFSTYDLIFGTDEKDWEKIKVADMMRPLNLISADENIITLFLKAKQTAVPIFAVCDPKNTEKHLGIVSIFTVTEKLFKF